MVECVTLRTAFTEAVEWTVVLWKISKLEPSDKVF